MIEICKSIPTPVPTRMKLTLTLTVSLETNKCSDAVCKGLYVVTSTTDFNSERTTEVRLVFSKNNT